MEDKEWAKLQEALLSEQLKVIRRFLRQKDGEKGIKERGMSKIGIVQAILQSAKCPLHVSEIIRRAEEDHQVTIQRESIVSALTKKVMHGETFVRVSPNTFGLKDKE